MGSVLSNMKKIDQLRQRLQTINQPLFDETYQGDTVEITKIRQALEQQYGHITTVTANERHSFQQAIINYRQSTENAAYLETKYCCFGLSMSFNSYCLLEDTPNIIRLIKNVLLYQSDARRFMMCYQGLLASYFDYKGLFSPHEDGKRNWLALRGFLAKHLHDIKNSQPPIEWTKVLDNHKNLLANNPCHRYGEKLLQGDESEFNALKEQLGISDNSWVIQEIISAQVYAATAKNDEDFIAHLPHLLTLLNKHPSVCNTSLAQLLDRYANCQNNAENVLLRNFALQHWGNPWLARKRLAWQTWAKDPVIKMVEKWLKLRALEDFFALLADDGTAKKERLDFWVRYVDDIDEVYFALGKQTCTNNKPDYREIRRYMDGRWMRLDGAGGGTNAFLMRIGDYLFIEFSLQGNACHVFSYHHRPFELGGDTITVMGTQEQLKNTQHYGHIAKLPHPEGWQEKFDNFISENTQKLPTSEPTIRANRPIQQTERTRQQPIQQPLLDEPIAFSITNVTDFCQANGRYTVIDNRNRGGNLWIDAPEHPSSMVLKQLTQWGFTYKTNKGWWKN